MSSILRILVLVIIGAAVLSCGEPPSDHAGAGASSAAAPTNRIDLPSRVRQNLGITWASAKRGRLEAVASIPGEITPQPNLDWQLHAPLAGTVLLIAKPWQQVEKGQVIARISSPDLADTQAVLHAARQEAREARLDLDRARAQIAPERELAKANERAANEALGAISHMQAVATEAEEVAHAKIARFDELTRLQASQAVSSAAALNARSEALAARRNAAKARMDLSDMRIRAAQLTLEATTARARAEATEKRLEILEGRLAAASALFDLRLKAFASLCGFSVERLADEEEGVPAWAGMKEFELRAPGRGVVTQVSSTTGAYAESGSELVRVVDVSTLMFQALLPEGDASRFPDKLEVRIAVPGMTDLILARDPAIRAMADAETRSILMQATLDNPKGRLRPGSSATAIVVTQRAVSEEILIPIDCVVRDGLESIVFVRDRTNADRVIRTPVTIGSTSGNTAEVIAGVGESDELVLEGVHQLRATGLGKAAGGHFHADGTWHEGDH